MQYRYRKLYKKLHIDVFQRSKHQYHARSQGMKVLNKRHAWMRPLVTVDTF